MSDDKGQDIILVVPAVAFRGSQSLRDLFTVCTCQSDGSCGTAVYQLFDFQQSGMASRRYAKGTQHATRGASGTTVQYSTQAPKSTR